MELVYRGSVGSLDPLSGHEPALQKQVNLASSVLVLRPT